MDKETMARGRVLDDLTKDMDEFEFEKKVKPLLTITISAGAPEMESEESEESEDGEEMDLEGLDPKLANLIRSKLG